MRNRILLKILLFILTESIEHNEGIPEENLIRLERETRKINRNPTRVPIYVLVKFLHF